VGFSDEELDCAAAGGDPRNRRIRPTRRFPKRQVQAVTRPGDVWLIGKHRLICGDCRDLAVEPNCSIRRMRCANVVHHLAALRDAARVRLIERLPADPAG
jgi:hypothetical protein